MSERLDITRPLKQRCGRAVKVLEPPKESAVIVGYYEDAIGKWWGAEWLRDGRRVGRGVMNPTNLVYADEPEPEAKPDDMAAILDRLHQIEQRLAGVVGDVDELWVSMRQNTGGKGKGKGCPLARLDAWAKEDPGLRSWSVVRQYDGHPAARAYEGGVLERSVTAQSPYMAAEALCTELGI